MFYKKQKLTDYEVEAVLGNYNLADGHARHNSWESCQNIFLRLPANLNQEEVEEEFRHAFFSFANQSLPNHSLYCPSASISIEIVANYLRLRGFSVGLIEPTFDNLADILKRHTIEIHSLAENRRNLDGIDLWLQSALPYDAIFLVCPNNPTGHLFSETDFQKLIDFCSIHKKLLILDFCFRLFAPEMLTWQQYTLLENSGIDYIAIEDTGKTWNTFELKVSVLSADYHTIRSLQSIYHDFFICHSPVVLAMVTELIKANPVTESMGSMENSILSIPFKNRTILREMLSGSFLRPETDYDFLPVEWLSITNDLIDLGIVEHLMQYDIHVLPGRYFFWNTPGLGHKNVRIALMRKPVNFREAIKHLRKALSNL